MNDSPTSEPKPAAAGGEEKASALFAQMILQQTNMAMMLLGQMPHPQSGETIKDLEAARMFIDQLEMLEVKTKGNLSPPETQFLKQSLLSLRMAFVEAVETPVTQSTPSVESSTPEFIQEPTPVSPIVAGEDESKKKFSKKY